MKTWSFSLFLSTLLLLLPVESLAHKSARKIFYPATETCAPELAFIAEEFSNEPYGPDGFITDNVYLTVPALIEAYRHGIWPWKINSQGKATWFSPAMRGILRFENLKISSRDMQFIRNAEKNGYRVVVDRDFAGVMRACQKMQRYETIQDTNIRVPVIGSWIKDKFVEEYSKLWPLNLAHSVEVLKNGQTVGGLYGVFVDGHFHGESMYHTDKNAVKLALFYLIQKLASKGHSWIDTEQNNGLIEAWGGEEIPRDEFLKKLDQAHQASLPF